MGRSVSENKVSRHDDILLKKVVDPPLWGLGAANTIDEVMEKG